MAASYDLRTELPAEHPDREQLIEIASAILKRARGSLAATLPVVIKDAIDFVLDPVRTGRTKIDDLDNVEKTFIGLKVEHFLRDVLDIPKGLRDLDIDGHNVDIKHTIQSSWMIPPETYRSEEACLLIATAEGSGTCSLGLLIARDSYLTRPNRDKKRGVSADGRRNIHWLVSGAQMPLSRWHGIDMARFRELRRMKGGSKRAATFFSGMLGQPVHRSIIQSLLHDQRDYMKRTRGNGGARDLLKNDGILLLSGTYDRKRAAELGHQLGKDEFIALRE